MALRCTEGHPSESSDYCDVCGMPIPLSASGGAGTPSGGSAGDNPPAPAAPAGLECPNCSVMNAAEALFCEACGYDFTTGTMPRPIPNPLDLDVPVEPFAGLTPAEAPAPDPEPAQPAKPEPAAQPKPSAQPEPAATPVPAPPTPEPDPGPASAPAPARPQPSGTAAAAPAAAQTAPAKLPGWVVEVWIDPEWYVLQQSPDPLPSPGLPTVIPLRKRSVLIGRPSRSRGITPDIDCEPDNGISRRQTQLSTDGTRWFVEDLDSANGTYLADASGPLPTTPIRSGRKHELGGDERIYLGAWTRLVLRQATPEEEELYAEG